MRVERVEFDLAVRVDFFNASLELAIGRVRVRAQLENKCVGSKRWRAHDERTVQDASSEEMKAEQYNTLIDCA